MLRGNSCARRTNMVIFYNFSAIRITAIIVESTW